MRTVGFNTVEQEVDAIRLQIYEIIKDMTPEEISEYYRKSGEASAKKYGFKRVENAITMKEIKP